MKRNNVLIYQNWPTIGLYVNFATIHDNEYSRPYVCFNWAFNAGILDKAMHRSRRRRFHRRYGMRSVVNRFLILRRQLFISIMLLKNRKPEIRKKKGIATFVNLAMNNWKDTLKSMGSIHGFPPL
jgi:hypothetical protein